MDFCAIFDKLMTSRGLSNYQLSKDTGISDSLIGYWRSGKRKPSLDNLVALSNYFGISIDSLVNEEENETSILFDSSDNKESSKRYAVTINDRFFALFDEMGTTQKEFCEATGIPKQTVSSWKSQRRDPPASLITTIADYFGVTAGYMLTGEEPKYPDNSGEAFSTKQLLAYYNALPEVEKNIILGKTAEMYAKQIRSSHEDT